MREVLRGSEVVVVEDDPYRDLWFDEAPAPPVVLGHEPARAIYLELPKTAAPGLRVGFLLGPPAIVRRCVLAKQATDLQTNTLGQHLLFDLLGHEGFARHVEGLRREYRARRDALDGGLAASLGDRLSWNRPGGGMFLWARIGGGGDAAEPSPTRSRRGSRSCPAASSTRRAKGRPRFASTSLTALPRGSPRASRGSRVRSGAGAGSTRFAP